MRHYLDLTVTLYGFLVCAVLHAADQPKPPTTSELSTKLATNCKNLKVNNDPGKDPDGKKPDWDKVTCAAAKPTEATDDEVSKCQNEVFAAAVSTFVAEAKVAIDKETADLSAPFGENESRIVQRLHPTLARREKVLNGAIDTAVRKAWKNLAVKAKGTDTLKERALAAIEAQKKVVDFQKLKDAVNSALFDACIDNDATVIEAIFPKAPTASEQQASNKNLVEQLMGDAERQAFAEFSKAEGFTRSVQCLWVGKDDAPDKVAKLTCKPGLLVSGQQISEIRINGLPSEAEVTALVSDQFVESDPKKDSTCTNDDDLSCDHLTFPQVHPNPIIVAVHTTRLFSPTWGTTFGMNLRDAKNILRKGKGTRSKLSIVTSGTAATISVAAKVGSDEASAAIPVGFARWKVESGGFLAVSKLVDDEVVSSVDPANNAKVNVTAVRRSDSVAQDSGVFANFVPQNYQSIGVSLGFSTPPNRRPSVYIGPNLRVRTFGDKGLASIGAGLTMRSVLRFPDLDVSKDGKPISSTNPTNAISVNADSAILKGVEQYRFHWYVAVNLGFRIGAFGPGEDEK